MKIGLIGWCVRTGIGAQNLDLWRLGFVDRWLAPRHPKLDYDEAQLPTEAQRAELTDTPDEWLDGLDVVLFIEHPFFRVWNVVGECRQRGIKTVCVPNMEWLPAPWEHEWAAQVDVMWATSEWCAKRLAEVAEKSRKSGAPCRWDRHIIANCWGVDCEKFPLKLRTKCERFVFVNGTGGVLRRKGVDVLNAAAWQMPDVPFVVRSQTAADLPRFPTNVELIVRDEPERWNIYDDADMLLCPTRWEGLGLQLYEAQAVGCLVAATDAGPMNEAGQVLPIRVAAHERMCLGGLPFDAALADPHDLCRIVREWHCRECWRESLLASATINEQHNLRTTTGTVENYLRQLLDTT